MAGENMSSPQRQARLHGPSRRPEGCTCDYAGNQHWDNCPLGNKRSAKVKTDRQETQRFAILNVLVVYTHRQLTPVVIDQIMDEIVTEMRDGACSWAFKEAK